MGDFTIKDMDLQVASLRECSIMRNQHQGCSMLSDLPLEQRHDAQPVFLIQIASGFIGEQQRRSTDDGPS